jgi:hypothetical protein
MMIENPEKRMPASQVSATCRIDCRAGRGVRPDVARDASRAFVEPEGREGRRAAFIVLLTSWNDRRGRPSATPVERYFERVTP